MLKRGPEPAAGLRTRWVVLAQTPDVSASRPWPTATTRVPFLGGPVIFVIVTLMPFSAEMNPVSRRRYEREGLEEDVQSIHSPLVF